MFIGTGRKQYQGTKLNYAGGWGGGWGAQQGGSARPTNVFPPTHTSSSCVAVMRLRLGSPSQGEQPPGREEAEPGPWRVRRATPLGRKPLKTGNGQIPRSGSASNPSPLIQTLRPWPDRLVSLTHCSNKHTRGRADTDGDMSFHLLVISSG